MFIPFRIWFCSNRELLIVLLIIIVHSCFINDRFMILLTKFIKNLRKAQPSSKLGDFSMKICWKIWFLREYIPEYLMSMRIHMQEVCKFMKNCLFYKISSHLSFWKYLKDIEFPLFCCNFRTAHKLKSDYNLFFILRCQENQWPKKSQEKIANNLPLFCEYD